MSFVAEASIFIAVAPEVAFDKLVDHPSWSAWMPKNFRPVGPSRGPLKVGDAVPMRIARIPFSMPIDVQVVDRPKEITWGGGSGLLRARHRFLFEAEGDGTRVRSVETWEGPIDRVVKLALKPIAESIAREQLEALRSALV